MRIYTLQVHKANQSEGLDELFHYSDFGCLCREYPKLIQRWEGCAKKVIENIHPANEDGEVHGGFKFVNADGSYTIGKVYDYDVLDDD